MTVGAVRDLGGLAGGGTAGDVPGRAPLHAVTTPPGPDPDEDPAPYGGRRLLPSHYEPVRLPREVARLGGTPEMLPAGSPGKVGLLELGFARTAHGTELVEHYQKSPLQIMRPLYYDPLRPDMPYTYLMSTGAGIHQGDRLRTDLTFGPGTSAYLTTTAYGRALRMPDDYAVAQVNLDVQEDAYVEHLPDPVIAFAGARLYQRTRATVHPTATLVTGETFVSGRLARGERHAYTVVASDVEIERPGGDPVAVDRVRLVPDERGTGGLAVLDDHDVLAMLYVVTPRVAPGELTDLLQEALTPSVDDGLLLGVSALPEGTGAWVRVVGDDTRTVARAMTRAWQSLRLRLTGRVAPLVRKS